MEIISNRPKELTVTHDDPRCVAVMARYGEADRMFTAIMSHPKLSPTTPSMVMMMRTYGLETVYRQIYNRLKISVLRMDESMLNDEEMGTIALNIVDDRNARVLGYDLVLEFFRRMEKGEFELYACKPRNIMAAWQQYAKHAAALQIRMKEEAERAEREKAEAEHRKTAITFEEYKRRTGLQ